MIPGFQADTLLGGQALTVSVNGCVPAGAVSEANEKILSLMGGQCRYVIMDLCRLTEASSKGVGLIAYYASLMRKKGGEVVIVPPAPEVLRRTGSKGLRSVTRFVSSIEEAIEYVRDALRTSESSRLREPRQLRYDAGVEADA